MKQTILNHSITGLEFNNFRPKLKKKFFLIIIYMNQIFSNDLCFAPAMLLKNFFKFNKIKY